jgi:hypothetical protein
LDYGEIVDGQYEYDGKLKQSVFYEGYALVLACNRITYKGINRNKIIPEDQISLLGTGRKLNLVGIVIYNNAHYTAVFRCANQWFYYDDLNHNQVDKIADNVQQLIKWRDWLVCTQGTLYFYI